MEIARATFFNFIRTPFKLSYQQKTENLRQRWACRIDPQKTCIFHVYLVMRCGRQSIV